MDIQLEKIINSEQKVSSLLGLKGRIACADYSQPTGIIEEARITEMILGFSEGVRGVERSIFAIIRDAETGKLVSGSLIKVLG